jgi:threonine synthase
MNFVTKMKCARCGKEYAVNSGAVRCAKRDDGRLDISYDYDAILDNLNKDLLANRKNGVWKYRELLPIEDAKNIVTLGEGGTPLVRARRLGQGLNLQSLWLLDDTRNPTGSFKDRPMTVGVSKAVELGYATVASASSGNAATALAAYSAKAGLRCVTFVPEMASIGKLAQLTTYGANIVKVRGLKLGEDPTVKLLKASCDCYNWYPCPSFGPLNAYQVEGPKTMAYEIAEQLEWASPDLVCVPVGAGGALTGNWKGFVDLKELDFIKQLPTVIAVQSTGCAPVVRAFEQGADPSKITAWEKPDSVATGLMDPFPWDGDYALKALKESHGKAIAVTNEEILEAQKLLAKTEGIFAEPSGVTSLAGLIKQLSSDHVERSETIVVEITGNGLKDANVVMKNMPEIPVIGSIEQLKTVLNF